MSEHQQYDDFFKKRLQNHESEVPRDLFDRLIEERDVQQPEFDAFFKNKLKDFKSAVPTDTFDSLMRKREFQHSPIYGFFRRMLVQHESPIPADMFEYVMRMREINRPIAWWQRRDLRISLIFVLLLTAAGIGFNLFKNKENNKNSPQIPAENATQLAKRDIAENTPKSGSPKDPFSIGSPSGRTTEGGGTETQSNVQDIKFSNQDKNQTYAGILKAKSNNQKENGLDKYAGPNITVNFNKNQNVEDKTLVLTTNSNSGIHPESSSIIQTQQAPAETEQNTVNAQTQQFYNPMNILSPLKTRVTEGVTFKALNPCGDPGNGCPTFGRRVKFGSFAGKSWYIDAYVSPEITNRSLKLKTAEGEALLRARDTTEKVLYGMSTGSRASLVFDNGLAFRAGVVYAVNNERYQKDSIAKQEILRIDRQTGELLGIDVIETTYRQTRYNKYKSIDFTLHAGYEVPINDFMSFSVNGGANLNYRSAKKVRFQTAMGTLDSVIHNFGERSPAIFENTWGISLVGSIAGYMQITNRMQLMIEPHIRYYMRPLKQYSPPV